MIEWIFAFVLGFGVVASVTGSLLGEDGLSSLVLKTTILIVALATFGFTQDDFAFGRAHITFMMLASLSLTEHYYFLVGGAFLAIIWALLREGTFQDWWAALHPETAPTDYAKAGQRSDFTSRREQSFGATLVGTSTEYLKTKLDLKTITLIKLCFYAFSNQSARTISQLEISLGLIYGKRQKQAQKIMAGLHSRPSLRRIIHPYWRAINGNNSAGRLMFSELCSLARQTGNTDGATIDRLMKVGSMLRLDPQDMARAIQTSLSR